MTRYEGPERRRHPRFPRPVQAQVAILGRGDASSSHVVNVSQGGLCARLRHPLGPGTPVKIMIVEETTGMSRERLARVTWSRPQNGHHETGLCFVEWRDISGERREHPRASLSRFVKYRYGSRQLSATIENLSEGGVSLALTHACPIGACLEAELPPTPLGGPRKVRIRILRLKPLNGERWLASGRIES